MLNQWFSIHSTNHNARQPVLFREIQAIVSAVRLMAFLSTVIGRKSLLYYKVAGSNMFRGTCKHFQIAYERDF